MIDSGMSRSRRWMSWAWGRISRSANSLIDALSSRCSSPAPSESVGPERPPRAASSAPSSGPPSASAAAILALKPALSDPTRPAHSSVAAAASARAYDQASS